jgi:hypothetical protein
VYGCDDNRVNVPVVLASGSCNHIESRLTASFMKTKKILYLPQFSMNSGSVIFPSRDGNNIILNTFIKYFASIEEINWDFDICLPPIDIIDEEDYSEFKNIIYNTTSKFKNIEYSFYYVDASPHISPIENRYSFNGSEIKDLLSNTNYSVIINNIPEISRNLIAFYPLNYKAKLISCHWFPDYFFQNDLTGAWQNGSKISYSFRQLDGILSSDANIFICDSTLNGWKDSIDKTFQPEIAKQIHANSKLLSLSVTDLAEYGKIAEDLVKDNPALCKFNKYTAVFPARITESGYTGWETAFKMFQNPGINGRIIFCNPSGEKGIKCIEKHFPNEPWIKYELPLAGEGYHVTSGRLYANEKILVFEEPLTKQQYYEIAYQSHSLVNFYYKEFYGGIGAREMMMIGNLFPFVPCIHEFKHWFRQIYVYGDASLARTYLPQEKNSIKTLVEKYNKCTVITGLQLQQDIMKNFLYFEDYVYDIPKFQTLIDDLKIV